jgi:hypothetical protein
MPALPLDDRLLAEALRLREEAAGHALASDAADAAAVAAGGDFAERLCRRAAAWSGAAEQRLALERAGHGLHLAGGVLILLCAVAGGSAASAALSSTGSASLPLVLMLLVGFNLLSLLLWLIGQLSPLLFEGGLPFAAGLAGLLRALGRWRGHGNEAARSAARLRFASAMARWELSSAVHSAWLAYTACGLLVLAALLSLRAYDLRWETTLLSPSQLSALAGLLSVGPGWFGVHPGEAAQGLMDSGARERWAHWLLAAVAVYGLLPRLLALAICAALLRRARQQLGCDFGRPGYARLRSRLMPDRRSLGIVDAAPAAPATRQASVSDTALPPPQTRWWALALDLPPQTLPPGAHWLGVIDHPASQAAILAALPAPTLDDTALAVLVRAVATPDRGQGRRIAELVGQARRPCWLVLVEMQRLRARGADTAAQRIGDWRRLARDAGCAGVLAWDAGHAFPPTEAASP